MAKLQLSAYLGNKKTGSPTFKWQSFSLAPTWERGETANWLIFAS
jgi:hypothetical protein